MAQKSTLTTVERVSAALAKAFDNRQSILVSCQLAHEGLADVDPTDSKALKARRVELADATVRALAALHGIDEADIEARAKVPANRPGGIGVSESAIKQRAGAYAHVLAAGLTPDILNVTAAFRLHSITGKGHAEYVAKVTERALSGEDFATAADEASEALTAARPGKGAKNAGGTSGEAAPLTFDAVIAVIDWTTANAGTFTAEQKADLADRLANLGAALA